MIRENFRLNHRENDEFSRSESREKEKRDFLSRQVSKNPSHSGYKLHIAHLPLGVSEEFVRLQFESYGAVEEVRIMRKDSNGQPLKGSLYGFVTMKSKEEADYALDKINGDITLGWNVSYSREKGHGDSPRSPQKAQRAKGKHNRDISEEKPSAKHIEEKIPSPAKVSENKENILLETKYSMLSEAFDTMDGDENGDRTETTIDDPDIFISYNNNHHHHHGSFGEIPTQDNSSLIKLLDHGVTKENTETGGELMKVLQLPPEKLAQLTSTMEKSMLNGNSILVRELWLGNLSQNLDEKKLRYTVEQFGDIENIEYYTKPNTSFAFVKFKEISQATRANEAIQDLRSLLNSPNLKIAFSDHQRRKNVVGDAVDYERDEELMSIIYLGFPTGANIAPGTAIRDMFSRYGEVKNIHINQMPKQNSAKSYALVEMATWKQAKFARQKLFFEDVNRENRTRLGDKNCELCILSKSKSKDSVNSPHMNYHRQNSFMQQQRQSRFSQFQPHNEFQPFFHHQGPGNMHPRMGPGHGFQQHPNPNFNGPMMNNREPLGPHMHHPNHMRGPFPNGPNGPNGPNQFPMNGPGHEMMEGPNKFMHHGVMGGGLHMQHGRFPDHGPNGHFHNHNPNINPNFGHPYGFNPNFGPNGMHGGFNPNHNINPNFNPNMYHNNNNFEGDRRGPNNMEYHDQSVFTSTTASSNAKSPKEKLSEINQESIWTGYITKSKQNRVGVDAIFVQGDESILRNEQNLNISHRTTYDEVTKFPIKAIVTFVPSNETQIGAFNDYIKYFLERDRAGFISLQRYSLYLLPPCEKAFSLHKFGNNELLGVLIDPKESSDHTNTEQTQEQNRENKEAYRVTDVAESNEEEDNIDVNEVMSFLNNPDLEKLLQEV